MGKGSNSHTAAIDDVDYDHFADGGGGGGWAGARAEARAWATTMSKMEAYSNPKLFVWYEARRLGCTAVATAPGHLAQRRHSRPSALGGAPLASACAADARPSRRASLRS